MLKKDGEIKVFLPKKKEESENKVASKEELVRYTIDDLVADSKELEEEEKK